MTTWKEKSARPVNLGELPCRTRQLVSEYQCDLHVGLASTHGPRGAPTEKERALKEREIWETLPRDRQVSFVRETFLKRVLDVSAMRARYRAAILRHGDICDPLWTRIDGPVSAGERPLSVNQANKLLGRAKKRAQAQAHTRLPFQKRLSIAVVELLAEHDGRPAVAALSPPDGNGSPPKTIGPKTIGSGEAKAFWSAHRQLVVPYIRSRLPADADPIFSEQLYKDFEESVKAAAETMGARIMRHRKTSREANAVTERTRRKRAKRALTIFGLDLPKKGKSLDREVLKRRYRKVAAAYHPDRHPGLEELMKERFKETTEAYEQVLDWCDYCDSAG